MRRRRRDGLLVVLEIDVLRARWCAAPCQVVGDGLTAEQRARRRPQVGRQLVVVLLLERGLRVLVLDLRLIGQVERRIEQVVVLVDRIGAHLLGTVNRWREAPLAGGVFRPTRRGREEVHRVVVGVALLDVGGVVGDRVGVVVVDVFVDDFVDGGLGLDVGGLGLEVVDGFGLERRSDSAALGPRAARARADFGLEVDAGSASSSTDSASRSSTDSDSEAASAASVDGFGFDRRRGRRRRSSTPPRAHRRPPGWFGGGGLGFVDVVKFLVPDDRDLTGQLGDGDGVAVATAPPAPAADGRGTDRAVPRQQLRDRDRSCAAVAVF